MDGKRFPSRVISSPMPIDYGSTLDLDNRNVSVADYEIVVSQALKNVRHLDRRNLETELRIGKEKKISRRCGGARPQCRCHTNYFVLHGIFS
jgi:hypothetical protein